MTKIFQSCRVMYGKDNFLKFFFMGIASIAVMLIGAALMGFVENESFIQGFIDGFCASLCGIVIILSTEMIILGAFGAVKRTYPGYKYFHSLADGFSHFKRTLIFANVTGLVFTALYVAVGICFFTNTVMLYITFVALFVMGWCDISGYSKKKWVTVVAFVMIGFSFGIISGILGDDALEILSPVGLAVVGVGAVFYIFCLVFALVRAEKLWKREEA